MKSKEMIIINDGQRIERSFAEKHQITEYCDVRNGIMTISFVGTIIQRDLCIISFPKHYEVSSFSDNDGECIKKILTLISMSRISSGSFDNGEKKEFPVRAYWEIANYYKKFGLYKDSEKYNELGYVGNVDWNRTVNTSNKLIVKNGIIFSPFVLRKTRNKSVLLSECMDFALGDAANYSEMISVIFNYNRKGNNRIFENLEYVTIQLNRIKANYFKDAEKRLIHGLIEYMEWKSRLKDNVRLLTLKFEDYWEKMVEVYLNGNFGGYTDDKIEFIENSSASFKKPKQYYVESNAIRKKRGSQGNDLFYRIELDHLYVDDVVYVFDSKYFNQDIRDMNYKQAYYHYHMKTLYPNQQIVNGLIMPTNKNYYTKTHIDRSDIDGVKIIEHYINLPSVIDYVLKHKKNIDFK
ncbi:LlaJI family restriction endonuclease [Erysipelothrix sp. HDW6A]|uniref:LlaJI family restriction endonuclease n=1 Tax=Erysipelothrix sp. HDW6A TaxID=2714928 RepID=UPI00140C8211|nr:LlaJI family restriction endonuclease [Erysipelothrix sp. HDW6A]QIK57936.1 LlaJI family restriction endonuclease [Erysipelothrix sp. HDW6A]